MIVVLKHVLQGERLEELEAEVTVLDAVDDEEILVVLVPDSFAKAHLLNPFFLRVCNQKFVIVSCKFIHLSVLKVVISSLALTSVRLDRRLRKVIVVVFGLAHQIIDLLTALKYS